MNDPVRVCPRCEFTGKNHFKQWTCQIARDIYLVRNHISFLDCAQTQTNEIRQSTTELGFSLKFKVRIFPRCVAS